MGIFGEKYSRREFEESSNERDEAQQEAQQAAEMARRAVESGDNIYVHKKERKVEARNIIGTDITRKVTPGKFLDIFDRRVRAAENRLQEILASGQIEAISLNTEYDLLRKRAEEAIEALTEFEREKLKMYRRTKS